MRIEFLPELNPGINPLTLPIESCKMIVWKCSVATCEHHIWSATINVRCKSKNNCSYCDGKKTCPCKSFLNTRPNVAKEFKPELNPGINPWTLSAGSGVKLVWQCSIAKCEHHIWSATVHNRCSLRKTDCPYCDGKKTCPCGSFLTINPKLALEFKPELNPNIDPLTISASSQIPLVWKCAVAECDHHIWKASPAGKRGCPFCFGSSCCPCDSFLVDYPHLATILDWNKNKIENIDVYQLSYCSIKRVWCKCDIHQHSWSITVSDLTHQGTRCSVCCESCMEYLCSKVLKMYDLVHLSQHKFIDCANPETKRLLPFDKYCKSINSAFEPDGKQHFEVVYFGGHDFPSDLINIQKRDQIKNLYCIFNKINLLRVSYSEKKNIQHHIEQFLLAVINRYENKLDIPVIHFCGKEYLSQIIDNNISKYIKFY